MTVATETAQDARPVTTEDPILLVNNIEVIYDSVILVLKGVSLEVPKGSIVAILVSAAVFTWYHPLANAAGTLSPQRVAFFFAAGVYFGAVFVVRGFGIVVAVHALYDLVVAVLLLGE